MILKVETIVRAEIYDLIYKNRSSGCIQATFVNEVVLVFDFVRMFMRFTPSADSFISRSAVPAAKFKFQTTRASPQTCQAGSVIKVVHVV